MSDIELIDSHCHLIFENFEKDLEDVILRLRSKGVKLVHACCELNEIPKLKKISRDFNEIYYSVGLHPLKQKMGPKFQISFKRSALEDKRVVAIVKLGLDFFKNENKTQQINALIPQMELAYELELLNIHCRDAADEMIEICNDLSNKGKCPKGVLHCWTGTPK